MKSKRIKMTVEVPKIEFHINDKVVALTSFTVSATPKNIITKIVQPFHRYAREIIKELNNIKINITIDKETVPFEITMTQGQKKRYSYSTSYTPLPIAVEEDSYELGSTIHNQLTAVEQCWHNANVYPGDRDLELLAVKGLIQQCDQLRQRDDAWKLELTLTDKGTEVLKRIYKDLRLTEEITSILVRQIFRHYLHQNNDTNNPKLYPHTFNGWTHLAYLTGYIKKREWGDLYITEGGLDLIVEYSDQLDNQGQYDTAELVDLLPIEKLPKYLSSEHEVIRNHATERMKQLQYEDKSASHTDNS